MAFWPAFLGGLLCVLCCCKLISQWSLAWWRSISPCPGARTLALTWSASKVDLGTFYRLQLPWPVAVHTSACHWGSYSHLAWQIVSNLRELSGVMVEVLDCQPVNCCENQDGFSLPLHWDLAICLVIPPRCAGRVQASADLVRDKNSMYA